MRYVLRIGVPDRPGALGAVAANLGEAKVDIESLEVIDRSEGMAVDDVRVVTTVAPRRLRALVERVPGAVVEALDVWDHAADETTPTGLAAALTECRGEILDCLVSGLPRALAATWAVAVADSAEGLSTLAASADAPAVPAGLRLPCFPLDRGRRLPQARWMPAAWTAAEDVLELCAAGLHGPSTAVLLARSGGPRFRPAELRRVAELARVAVAVTFPPKVAAPLG